MKIGDKVRAIRDFSVEPLFDDGWLVKKGDDRICLLDRRRLWADCGRLQ
jgi:hypothetical protein